MSPDDSEIDEHSKGGRYTNDGSYSNSRQDIAHKRLDERRVEEMRIKSAMEKRMHDLEDKIIEMEEMNRNLKAELQAVKKSTNQSTKNCNL